MFQSEVKGSEGFGLGHVRVPHEFLVHVHHMSCPSSTFRPVFRYRQSAISSMCVVLTNSSSNFGVPFGVFEFVRMVSYSLRSSHCSSMEIAPINMFSNCLNHLFMGAVFHIQIRFDETQGGFRW